MQSLHIGLRPATAIQLQQPSIMSEKFDESQWSVQDEYTDSKMAIKEISVDENFWSSSF